MPKVLIPAVYDGSPAPHKLATVHWDNLVMSDATVTIKIQEGYDSQDTTLTPLESADFDRAGINHLIQVLRRARDAAYGRDE